MQPSEYATRLSDLDELIGSVDSSIGDYWVNDDARNLAYVITNLTDAMLAVAKGVRLLAEPVEKDARGTFAIISRDDDEDGDLR